MYTTRSLSTSDDRIPLQNADILAKITKLLFDNFKMKDMGSAKGCIGIRIHQNGSEIMLDQEVYTLEVLKRFGMEDCKPIGTPCDTNEKLSSVKVEAGDSLVGKVPYQEAVGSLLYLAQGTRPDISHAVNEVSRYNNNHGTVHWKAVKHILRYLRGTLNYKLRFFKGESDELVGFSDANWGSDELDRRSWTGYLFKMSNGAITWKSGRQKTVALSSTEAEYMALSACIQEAIWLMQLGREINLKIELPLQIHCDNQSAALLAKNDGYRPRTKHIDIRYHYIREIVETGRVKICYLETSKMIADSLTKPVGKEKTEFCTQNMGLTTHRPLNSIKN